MIHQPRPLEGTQDVQVIAGRSPYGCSYLSELLALTTALETVHLHREQQFIIFCDNQALVDLVNQALPGEHLHRRPYSYYYRKLLRLYFPVKQRTILSWIRAHQGFQGNEYADQFANWGSTLRAPPSEPAPLGSPKHRDLILTGKVPYQIFQSLIPSHQHLSIHKPTSFLPWYRSGPFQKFPFIWQNGLLNVRTFLPCTQLNIGHCPTCNQEHAGDALSFLAHCARFQTQRNALIDTMTDPWKVPIETWVEQAGTQDRRLFFRGLVPNTLAQTMTNLPGLRDQHTWQQLRTLKKVFNTRAPLVIAWMHTTLDALKQTDLPRIQPQRPGADQWASTWRAPSQPDMMPFARPRPPPQHVLPPRRPPVRR